LYKGKKGRRRPLERRVPAKLTSSSSESLGGGREEKAEIKKGKGGLFLGRDEKERKEHPEKEKKDNETCFNGDFNRIWIARVAREKKAEEGGKNSGLLLVCRSNSPRNTKGEKRGGRGA